MQISPESLDKLFEKCFERGCVLATELHFSGGTSKKKYLIVLNQNPQDSETLLFLTTSKIEFFKKHPAFKDHVVINAGQLPYFPLETVINCHGVQALARISHHFHEKCARRVFAKTSYAFSQKGLSFARSQIGAQNFGHKVFCPKRFSHREENR